MKPAFAMYTLKMMLTLQADGSDWDERQSTRKICSNNPQKDTQKVHMLIKRSTRPQLR